MPPIPTSETATATPRDRGFALLIVLWSLVLLSLMSAQILAAGRTAVSLAANLRAAAQARAAADGAIYAAIYDLAAPGSAQWPVDGSPHALNIGGLNASVRVISLGGKINPNIASTALLAGFFQALGAPSAQARDLAEAIIVWRSPQTTPSAAQAIQAAYKRAGLAFGPPGANFADLSELAAVIGMPPNLLASAMPHMSLYQTGDPDPKLADPIVLKALRLAQQPGLASTGYTGTSPVFLISAEAGMSATLDVHRQAVVSISGGGGPPFQILSLTDGY
jgi:general secretion pathway protein K